MEVLLVRCGSWAYCGQSSGFSAGTAAFVGGDAGEGGANVTITAKTSKMLPLKQRAAFCIG